ncbi:hypothetical protein BDZ89DRAFT_1070732 [Hymenopellis radicata]|nr:hypothetical protein BDZ89DRAFT_1070732 [Hymenopellis radicata]
MAPLPQDQIRSSAPLLTGFMIHWCLFSTLSVQTYIYYEARVRDRWVTTYLVYGVYAMEVVQTAFVIYDAFAIFVYGFGDVDSLPAIHFHWLTIPIMSGLVSCASQLFYAYRIFILSKRHRIAPLIISSIALGSAGAGLLSGYYAYTIGSLSQLTGKSPSLAIGFWCGGAAVCDILIAIFMTRYLTKCDTGFRHTRLLISKLIRVSVETGTLTAVVAILDLILFFAFPNECLYISISLWLPKLYANAMIMVINARFRILSRDQADDHPTESIHLQFSRVFARSAYSSSRGTTDDLPPSLPVTITTEVSVHSDS